MKIRTVEVREGEDLGPIIWSYDFRSHFNNRCTNDANKDRACRRAVEVLRILEDHLKRDIAVEATTYGGWPRVGWNSVLAVSMYDGWPWWRPVPSVKMTERVLGGVQWHDFSTITDIRRLESKATPASQRAEWTETEALRSEWRTNHGM